MQPSAASNPPTLEKAKAHLGAGEFYQARKMTEQVLSQNPENEEAQQLMAEILDQEIERHKEAFEARSFEELSVEESKDEIKTWLERSHSLLEVKEYEEALEAAENVFLFDSTNAEASQLIDHIRREAIKNDKEQLLVRDQTLGVEVDQRVKNYYGEAQSAILQGKWGAAQFAVHKMLLLEPENEKALKLKKQIQEHLGESSS